LKTITVQSFHGDEKVEESKITVEDNETLVMQYLPNVPIEKIAQLHNNVSKALGEKQPLITVPKDVEFKVIST